MKFLDTITKSLEFKLVGAVTTNQLDFTTSYADTSQASFGMTAVGQENGVSNDTTAVTLLTAPADGFSRQLKHISIYNNDTVAATIIVQVNDNTTIRQILSVSLGAGGTLEYIEGRGWIISFSGADLPGTLIQVHTGLLTGGNLSIGTDTAKFDIEAGSGFVVDNYTNPASPNITEVIWTAFDEISVTDLAANHRTYIAIDVNGAVIQQPNPWTNEEIRDLIVLGLLIHPNNISLQAVTMFPVTSYDMALQFADITEAIGKINNAGNIISPNGANLNINKSAGEIFSLGGNYGATPSARQNPSVVSSIAQTPITFNYRYQDGVGGIVEDASVVVIEPALYDDGSGTPASVASNKWTTQRIWCFPSGVIKLMYGQTIYNSEATAEAAIFGEEFNADPNLLTNAVLRGWLIVKGNAADLTDSAKAKFIEADKFGHTPSGGVSSSTTSLQQAYNNSVNPEIETNSVLGAASFKRGSTADTDDVLEVLNGAGTQVAAITGEGDLSANEGLFDNFLTLGAISGAPRFIIQRNTLAADNKRWRHNVSSGAGLVMSAESDDQLTTARWLQVLRSGVAITSIGYGNAADSPDHTFYGNLILGVSGKGIDFSAAGGGLFDFYEEDAFSPVLTDGVNNAVHDIQEGHFRKSGSRVDWNLTIRTTSLGSVSGSLFISGFPFTSKNESNNISGGSAVFASGLAIAAGTNVTVAHLPNNALVSLRNWDLAGGVSDLQASEWSANGFMVLFGTYEAV